MTLQYYITNHQASSGRGHVNIAINGRSLNFPVTLPKKQLHISSANNRIPPIISQVNFAISPLDNYVRAHITNLDTVICPCHKEINGLRGYGAASERYYIVAWIIITTFPATVTSLLGALLRSPVFLSLGRRLPDFFSKTANLITL